MAFEDWETRQNGDIVLCPLLGYQTALGPMTGLLRITIARDQQEFDAGGSAVQLVLTPVQLRELAQALVRMAEQIDAQDKGTAQ